MMDAIEKLARDICWAEFPSHSKDETKVSYWRKIHPDAKAGYIIPFRINHHAWARWVSDARKLEFVK